MSRYNQYGAALFCAAVLLFPGCNKQDNSKANFDWLCDVKTRLSAIDGTEALVEGFGASSGRAARTF